MVTAVELPATDRKSLADLDAEDVLAHFRDRFLIPDDLIYMNGNSLGPLTIDARDRMATAVNDEWGQQLIRGWNTAGWYDMAWRLGDKIGRLIGAEPGETVVGDSTSVNLFKVVAAACALRSERTKIVSEAGNFPTDLYVLDGFSRFAKTGNSVEVCQRDDILNAIDTDTAVVVLTHVHYVSGEIFPMADITVAAHEAGALIIWDLSHSAGAVDTDLNAAGADFAVGCGYKHLNGGPGAPAFAFAAKRHHDAMRQPLSGWFSHAKPFDFKDEFEPADGVSRLLCGTTGVLGATALEASVDLMLEVDLPAMYAKSKRLGRLFLTLADESCGDFGLTINSPGDDEARGAHVSIAHEQAYAIMQNLIARGVIGDFRAPDNMRFGFSPLFMRYTDVYDAAQILYDILRNRSYEDPQYSKKNAVT